MSPQRLVLDLPAIHLCEERQQYDVDQSAAGEGDGPDDDPAPADRLQQSIRRLVNLDDTEDATVVGEDRHVDLGQRAEHAALIPLLRLVELLDLDLDLSRE